MRVEVDRERKASSSCRDTAEKKNFEYLILTPIKAIRRGDSRFKAWLFPLQLPIAYQFEYMLAGSCNEEDFLLALFMIPKVSPLSCKQFIRQTFVPLISDWTLSTPGTHWRPDPRGGLERHASNESVGVLRWLNTNSFNKRSSLSLSLSTSDVVGVFLFFITSKQGGHLLRRLWLLGSGVIDLWVSTRYVQ